MENSCLEDQSRKGDDIKMGFGDMDWIKMVKNHVKGQLFMSVVPILWVIKPDCEMVSYISNALHSDCDRIQTSR
jgi:hypothetical protein